MTVMTKKQVALLDQLVGVAGNADIVERALRDLNNERRDASDIRLVIRRIFEIRNELGMESGAATV